MSLSLAIGGESDSPSGLSGGAVNVIYGTIFLLQPPGNQLWSQDSAFIEGVQGSYQ